MMSSIGGRTAAPFAGAYSASKFALEGMSESLRRELMVFGIDVIVIAPGAIATPIWTRWKRSISIASRTPVRAVDEIMKAVSIENGRRGLPAEVIGRTVLEALTALGRRRDTRLRRNPSNFFSDGFCRSDSSIG